MIYFNDHSTSFITKQYLKIPVIHINMILYTHVRLKCYTDWFALFQKLYKHIRPWFLNYPFFTHFLCRWQINMTHASQKQEKTIYKYDVLLPSGDVDSR